MRGLGQTGQPIPQDAAAYVDVEPDGTRVYKPAVHDAIVRMLSPDAASGYLGMSVIPLDATNVKLDPAIDGDTRQGAADWMRETLSSGKSVLFGSPSGLVAAVAPMANVDRFLKMAQDHATELDYVGPNTMPTAALLGRPAVYQAKALGPVGISLLALAIGGMLYFGYEAVTKGTSS